MRVSALTFLVLLPATACSQLLSYDDYRERPVARADSAVVVDTSVADTSVVDAGPPPARAPSRPAGAASASGTGKTLWLAVRSYSYGATDPAGVVTPTAWTSYGYDLDGVCTTERDSITNVDTCRRPAGAKQDSLTDGVRCRDNAFGRTIAATLSVLPDSEKTLNDLVMVGSTTWILRLDDVDPGVDDTFAPGALYRSSDDRTTTPPKWDGLDDRAVQSDSLVDGDLTRPVLTFPRGFVSGGVWVSGDPAPMQVIAALTSVGFFPLNLQHAFMTLELDAARTTGAHGILAGVLPGTEVKNTLDPIADFLRVCPGSSLYDDTLARFDAMLDLTVGAPTLQDVERTCDGASVAVAFEVVPIKPVTRVVPPLPPRKPRCGDAG